VTDEVRSRRRALGRGLDALLATTARPETAATDADAVLSEVAIDAIAPNPEQPRSSFDDESLAELAESIRIHGVIQPIVVESDGRGSYRLIAGERRHRAARLAGLATVPAVIRPATESSRHALELALIENLQRADLNALEEASAYARLADAFAMTHEAIGLRVGKSRAAVANTMRLLQLPASIQAAIAGGHLSAGHARALLALPTSGEQERLAERVMAEGLSVREVEAAVRDAGEPGAGPAAEGVEPGRAPSRRGAAALSPDDTAVVRGLEEALGTPVRLERRRRGGRLVVDFFDDDQLDGIYRRLGGPPL
jgi:ParB family chromosome partitioning protein